MAAVLSDSLAGRSSVWTTFARCSRASAGSSLTALRWKHCRANNSGLGPRRLQPSQQLPSNLIKQVLSPPAFFSSAANLGPVECHSHPYSSHRASAPHCSSFRFPAKAATGPGNYHPTSSTAGHLSHSLPTLSCCRPADLCSRE